MQEKQSQLRNQFNQDCVSFKEKSYVKYNMARCKNKENGGVKSRDLKSLPVNRNYQRN
jgi:hypothetical protein